MKIKRMIGNIPVFGTVAYRIHQKLFKPFRGSERYWQDRYDCGGNSGDGSYDELARFKAEVINSIVLKKNISSVIEYGCGDGNQLGLAQYPNYRGFDVSSKAISICESIFSGDDTKSFALMNEYSNESAELTLSLDVIYHLIEDKVFNNYMERLFDSSKKFVIIYSSNTAENPKGKMAAAHVRHRKFSDWISQYRTEWELLEFIPNKHSLNESTGNGSFADFHIYMKTGSA